MTLTLTTFSGDPKRPTLKNQCSKVQLFDLKNDISETTNVAEKHPKVVKRLMKQIENARDELGDCGRIGRGARFFNPDPKRPGIKKYKSWLAEQKK